MGQGIQRKRTKGWKMPPDTVYVGRPTKWGNMFYLTDVLRERHEMDVAGIAFSAGQSIAARCVEMYREELLTRQMADPAAFEKWLAPLRGKNLACWCPLDRPCHRSVLIELASESINPLFGESE